MTKTVMSVEVTCKLWPFRLEMSQAKMERVRMAPWT